MGLLNGSFSGERFRVGGTPRRGFGEGDLEALERHAIGGGNHTNEDGTEIGFTAGAHLFDLRFAFDKNLFDDCLQASIRIDTTRPPSALIKAYTEMELAALSADNPSGLPTKQQKKEAKEAALARCEAEAKDGRFRRSKVVPFLWDARQSLVWLASGSNGVIDHFRILFEAAFDTTLERINVSQAAEQAAADLELIGDLADVQPLLYHSAGESVAEYAWMKDDANRHGFLGNEFLLWLCRRSDVRDDVLTLADGSEITWLTERSVVLECPLGLSGKESIQADAPLRLPEARLALRTGKLPRKVGLTLARDNRTYQLGLQGELLSLGTVKFPSDDDEQDDERLQRVQGFRELHDTLELLFREFCRLRLSDAWNGEAERLRDWVRQAEPLVKQRPAA